VVVITDTPSPIRDAATALLIENEIQPETRLHFLMPDNAAAVLPQQAQVYASSLRDFDRALPINPIPTLDRPRHRAAAGA
jgi:hypothetical protein